MASSQNDSSVFERTRETLGKIIKKPPLTDKLLGRPPFRYLHDIISEVSKQTRFFNGLYTPKEMDAKSIQERDDKIAFLQKAIDTLSFTTGELVKVRPSKVVAGHEAEKTNEFLQILGISILKELDSSEAIQKVLNGEKPAEALTKEKKKRRVKEKSSSKERQPAGKKDSSSTSRDKTREDRKPSTERDRKGKRRESEESGAALKSKSLRSLKDSQKPEQGSPSSRPTHRPSRTRPPLDSEAVPTNDQGDPPSPIVSGEDEGLGSETVLDRPSSAKGTRRRNTQPTSDNETETVPSEMINGSHENPTGVDAPPSPTTGVPQPKMAPTTKRPGSARPAPPKIVQSNLEETIARIPSGGVTAHEGPPVILDTPNNDRQSDGEDDDQFVVQDSTPLELPDTDAFMPNIAQEKPEGALTKNIVAMKEHLEGDVPKADQQSRHEHTTLSEAQRQKEREIVTKEIEKLQASIQTLCKSANPLGKIMDYVQEDMDSMQKELETWKTENEKHAESLRKEERITEQELLPLRGLLEDLENKLKEQIDLISTTKANIVRNDDKIQQMLNSITLVA